MKWTDPIRYVDLETGEVREEDVYGGFWVGLLYGTPVGRAISGLIAMPPLSRFYGWLQDRPSSSRKVGPFIERFGIEMADFISDDDRPSEDPYTTFNSFFTRRLRVGSRPFAPPPAFPAPCDGRYFGYGCLDERVSIPVKGSYFDARALVQNERWVPHFAGGPGFVARLCPVDYHRFHFPDDGEVLATWRIPGALHSVNPWALAGRPEIFMLNERQVTILETEHFGKLAHVEIGATCVGKIVQIHGGGPFGRGDEKGMFLFGGSTVIVIGEKGRWTVDREIRRNTGDGIETYIRAGRALGCQSGASRGG